MHFLFLKYFKVLLTILIRRLKFETNNFDLVFEIFLNKIWKFKSIFWDFKNDKLCICANIIFFASILFLLLFCCYFIVIIFYFIIIYYFILFLLVETASHEGKRKAELTWPVFRIHHQRSRYIYDLFYRKKTISKELFEFCLDQGYADAALVAKWKKVFKIIFRFEICFNYYWFSFFFSLFL
jgi:hypothetical protein